MSKSELRGYNFIEDFVRMNEDPLVFSLENDLALYNPETDIYIEPPKNPFDYSTDFS